MLPQIIGLGVAAFATRKVALIAKKKLAQTVAGEALDAWRINQDCNRKTRQSNSNLIAYITLSSQRGEKCRVSDILKVVKLAGLDASSFDFGSDSEVDFPWAQAEPILIAARGNL